MKAWVSQNVRDEIVDFVDHYSPLTGLSFSRLVGWIGVGRYKFWDWRSRYGKANAHNAPVPRNFWLAEWEKRAIIAFQVEHPEEGYRRLAFMMLDANIVAVSPSSTYRVLTEAGLMRKWNGKASKKGTGFDQPLLRHEHWHVDVSYINVCGTFYYFCGIIDGFSRFIVHWEIREAMKESDIEIIIERAKEKFPDARPRVISDNGPQFISRDFKEFIRLSGMTHVRTSPYYPQSNGKIERFHKTLKEKCIRPKTPLTLEDAREITGKFIETYNNTRLHSSIGYIAPRDKLEGRSKEIFAARNLKLHEAQERRKARSANKTSGQESVAQGADSLSVPLLLTYSS